MTFSITVPNASQSPGLFPAQNNTNFSRIKDIINNDHNFTDSTAANQGVHNQVTFIDRTAPGSLLAGTNGILYSEDVSGDSQLRYYNGSSTYNLTPTDGNPIKVFGSAVLNGGANTTAYADPGFLWCGTGWAIIQATSAYQFYNIIRSGSNNINLIKNNSGVLSNPSFSFSSNNLIVTNNAGSVQTIVWSLIINRIS